MRRRQLQLEQRLILAAAESSARRRKAAKAAKAAGEVFENPMLSRGRGRRRGGGRRGPQMRESAHALPSSARRAPSYVPAPPPLPAKSPYVEPPARIQEPDPSGSFEMSNPLHRGASEKPRQAAPAGSARMASTSAPTETTRTGSG